MNWGNIGIVFRKELKDTLRDRRTLISSIVIPILLFPVLFLGLGGLTYVIVTSAVKASPTVMLIGEEHAPRLTELIRQEKELKVVPVTGDYKKQIDGKTLRAAVEFPPGFEENIRTKPDQPQAIRIYKFEGEIRSESVAGDVRGVIDKYEEEIMKERLAANRLTRAQVVSFETEQKNVASAEKVAGNIIGFLLPYLAIVLCYSGAMYPAMDLTAGEKERGTMETLLVSPVRRVELVIGKTLLVILTSVVTAALSIASLGVTAAIGAGMLARMNSDVKLAVSIESLVLGFAMILPLAVIFSAVLFAVSLYARNYREAQAYAGQSIFLVILPAIPSMIPGIQLNAKLAFIPILNVSLAMKEIFAGQYPWGLIALIFLSTAMWGALAVYLAVWQFHREEVLFRT